MADRSDVDNVLAHVRKQGGHWIYGGASDKDGYGVVRTGSRTDGTRRMQPAAVVVYEHYHGPVPAGYEVDHECHVRGCVAPKHLRAVPKSVNLANRQRYATSNPAARTTAADLAR